MRQILFITPFTPCNKDAGSNYTKQLLEKLSETNQIDLIFFKYKDDPSYIPPNNVNVVYCKKNSTIFKLLDITLFPFLYPLFTVRFNWKIVFKIRALLREKKYDIIYFDFSQTFLYSKFIKHNHKILMSHDVIYQRYKRKNNIFISWIKCSEKWLLKGKSNNIFTFSIKDSQILNNIYHIPSKNICFFIPDDAINSIPTKIQNNITFFAMWKRADNYQGLLWFINNILPHITCQVTIIGGGLSTEIQKQIKSYSNINYMGFVNNPYPIISNSKALISPLFNGAGVKVKVIEALACGTPIIGTKIAFEGIDYKFQKFMIEASNPSEFIHAIKSIEYTIEEHITFKKKFLKEYCNNTILDYINN